jgi:hypothetical protein
MHQLAFLLPFAICAVAAVESTRAFVSIVQDDWPSISLLRAAFVLACIVLAALAAAVAFTPPLAWIAGALAR